jgi:hypothetical protein
MPHHVAEAVLTSDSPRTRCEGIRCADQLYGFNDGAASRRGQRGDLCGCHRYGRAFMTHRHLTTMIPISDPEVRDVRGGLVGAESSALAALRMRTRANVAVIIPPPVGSF